MLASFSAFAEDGPGFSIAAKEYVDGGLAQRASAAQGALADTAVQPGDLADVATTGSYEDLSGKPELGSAATADAEDFATAAQGTKADNAVLTNTLGTFEVTGILNIPTPVLPTAP